MMQFSQFVIIPTLKKCDNNSGAQQLNAGNAAN